MQRFTHITWPNLAGAALAALMTVVAGVVVARAVVVDRNQGCVVNLYALGQGLAEYAEDYDEKLPPVGIGPVFQNDVLPYTQTTSVFFCPATRNSPYAMNTSIVTALTQDDPGTVNLLYDTVTHPNGALTILFLDGHVTQGGVYQPNPSLAVSSVPACTTEAKRLLLYIESYAQDYGVLPPMTSDAALEAALEPYFGNYAFFYLNQPFYVYPDMPLNCPETHQPYQLNASLSGASLYGFSNPGTVEVFRDSQLHSDGTVTIAYLDGHVVRVIP